MPTAYLDHAATTPLRPAARAAMDEVLDAGLGNPSGQHRWARAARRRLDDARDQVAEVLGVHPGEVVFTSGGTEADNLAVTGTVAAAGGVAMCLATDHHAVLEPVRAAGGRTVPVDHRTGLVDPDELGEVLAATPGVSLASMALANNELGVVQPVDEAVEVVRQRAPGAAVHLDAVAAAAWLDVAARAARADLVSVSGHKVGGPAGVGALVVRRDTALGPLLRGGSQERGRRAGTPSVAAVAGFAAALAASAAERDGQAARVTAQRDRLEAAILAAVPHAVASVDRGPGGPERVANIAHLSAWGVHREALLFRLDERGVAASAGSSCASGALEPSHVVEALGWPEGLREGPLRLSLGWSTTDVEVDHAAAEVIAALCDLRGTAPGGPGW